MSDAAKTPPTKLNNNNYYAWSYRMQMQLRKLGVWTIVGGLEEQPLGSPNSKAVKAFQIRSDLAVNEIIGEVEDSQLVHTRVSMEPSEVWERLKEVHMSEGLGSIISLWQKFFKLKKEVRVSVQTHVAVLREISDRLTGLDNAPTESLMVAVLMLSLPDLYLPLVISLDAHPRCTNFDFVVQRCLNEEARQLSIWPVQRARDPQNAAYHSNEAKGMKPWITCHRCGKKGHYKNECKEDIEEKENKEKGKGKEKEKEKETAAIGYIEDVANDSDDITW